MCHAIIHFLLYKQKKGLPENDARKTVEEVRWQSYAKETGNPPIKGRRQKSRGRLRPKSRGQNLTCQDPVIRRPKPHVPGAGYTAAKTSRPGRAVSAAEPRGCSPNQSDETNSKTSGIDRRRSTFFIFSGTSRSCARANSPDITRGTQKR